ncbi:MAG: hypothetical protein KC994_25770, partial [Candidatus Omnitrophica bacterium]|nr:hypothetical protein [Candidatus Omnitrophota bacterium]
DMGAFEYIGEAVENSRPTTPINTYPQSGMQGVSLVTSLRTTGFSDPDTGDSPVLTDWQISKASDFAEPVFSATSVGPDFASFDIKPGTLEFDTVYWWRARVYDNLRLPSPWSKATFFRTRNIGDPHVIDFEYGGSIQDEILAATDGDVLIVLPGIYDENLVLGGASITLRSLDPQDPEWVAATIIDGGSRAPTLMFSGFEEPDCAIEGITLQNGKVGILGNHTLATLRHNRIVGNQGGIVECDGLIEANYLADNVSETGAGLWSCGGAIRNNLIIRNRATGECAQSCFLYCYDLGFGRIECHTVCTPSCAQGLGGGIRCCNGDVMNNTIYGNTAPKGAGIADCLGTLKNNIVWGNLGLTQIDSSAPSSYSCIQGSTDTTRGNIFVDPLFVDPDRDAFHLSAQSPCIDAGGFVAEVDLDFEGEPRPFDASPEPRGDGSDFDIGADEYSYYPISLVDQNQDSRIDAMDLFEFQGDWMWKEIGGVKGDLNHDLSTDAEDLLFLLKGWGQV